MLVLTRKTNESIMIGDEIEVVVVAVHGEQIKLGITAPKHIAVHRREVYDAIQKENVEASKRAQTDLKDVAKLFKDKKK